MLYEIFAMQFIFSFMYCLWNIIAIDRLLSADTGPERASSVAGRAFPLTNGLFFNRPIFCTHHWLDGVPRNSVQGNLCGFPGVGLLQIGYISWCPDQCVITLKVSSSYDSWSKIGPRYITVVIESQGVVTEPQFLGANCVILSILPVVAICVKQDAKWMQFYTFLATNGLS